MKLGRPFPVKVDGARTLGYLTPERRYTATEEELKYDSLLRDRDRLATQVDDLRRAMNEGGEHGRSNPR